MEDSKCKLKDLLKILCVVVFFIAIILGIIGFLNYQVRESNKNEVLMSVDSVGLLDFMDKKYSGYVYVGRPTCPHCKAFKPVLEDVAKQNKVQVLYYNTDSSINKVLKEKVLSQIDVKYVPVVLKISNGKVESRLDGTEQRELIEGFLE